MEKIALTLAASTLMLAVSLSGLSAQPGGGPMMRDGQGPRGPMMDTDRSGRDYFGPGMMTDLDRRGRGYSRPGFVMEGGMPGYGIMGHGMMGHGMMRMMLIVMDTDGDGALSLAEFQAVHARIFAAMDSDDDGALTFEEMESFMEGEPIGDDNSDDDR